MKNKLSLVAIAGLTIFLAGCNGTVSVQDMKGAFSNKHPNIDYANYTITIDNNYQDTFVKGLVGPPEGVEGGGAHYWAAKVNGEWIIVTEAQDNVSCSVFAPYNFPQEIIGKDAALPCENKIGESEARSFATQLLKDKGVTNVDICKAEWIAAPLGGYLVDGVGDFTVATKQYSIFRIGVRDGSEGNAGKEFAFIASGKDGEGTVIWYPEPGPDFRPAEGETFPEELIVYQSLTNREQFESLFDGCK